MCPVFGYYCYMLYSSLCQLKLFILNDMKRESKLFKIMCTHTHNLTCIEIQSLKLNHVRRISANTNTTKNDHSNKSYTSKKAPLFATRWPNFNEPH